MKKESRFAQKSGATRTGVGTPRPKQVSVGPKEHGVGTLTRTWEDIGSPGHAEKGLQDGRRTGRDAARVCAARPCAGEGRAARHPGQISVGPKEHGVGTLTRTWEGIGSPSHAKKGLQDGRHTGRDAARVCAARPCASGSQGLRSQTSPGASQIEKVKCLRAVVTRGGVLGIAQNYGMVLHSGGSANHLARVAEHAKRSEAKPRQSTSTRTGAGVGMQVGVTASPVVAVGGGCSAQQVKSRSAQPVQQASVGSNVIRVCSFPDGTKRFSLGTTSSASSVVTEDAGIKWRTQFLQTADDWKKKELETSGGNSAMSR